MYKYGYILNRNTNAFHVPTFLQLGMKPRPSSRPAHPKTVY